MRLTGWSIVTVLHSRNQAPIDIDFHLFTEIGQIFHNKCTFNE